MEEIALLRIEMKGFEALDRRLKELSKRVQELDGVNRVPLTELFPPTFIQQHSRFSSLESLIEASGFKIESQKDFENIPDDVWDRFIATNTTFSSWHEMLQAATAEWVKSKLGL